MWFRVRARVGVCFSLADVKHAQSGPWSARQGSRVQLFLIAWPEQERVVQPQRHMIIQSAR
jgi:hypothetical protein